MRAPRRAPLSAAFQVRVEGELLRRFEDWRRSQPEILPRTKATRELLKRALIDARRAERAEAVGR